MADITKCRACNGDSGYTESTPKDDILRTTLPMQNEECRIYYCATCWEDYNLEAAYGDLNHPRFRTKMK